MDPAPNANRIDFVTIVGAGWTGRQIAGQMAAHGVQVRLVDPDEKALEASRDWIERHREVFADDGYWPACSKQAMDSRIEYRTADSFDSESDTSEPESRVPGLVLESAPEQAALKRRILRKYSEAYTYPTIIASNSSYFTPSMFAHHIAAPERFAHFHFHVPIWRATIVDIASSPLTDEATRSRLTELAHRIGQTPLVNRVENSGYVFNWMLKALLQSALQLHDKGVATPEEIELAWTKATGMPVGPFGIMDQIGIDIIYQTVSHARFVDGDDVWMPLLERLQPLIDQGRLGVKSGHGFFEYPDRQVRSAK